MNLSNINTKATELTKSNSASYTDAQKLIDINIWNQNVVTWIIDSQDSSDFDDQNYTGYATLSKTLVANQRDYNFGISEGVIEIKRVDVSYDAVKSYRAFPIDSSQLGMGLQESYTNIDSLYSITAPAYDWKYNSIFLVPKPTDSTGSVEAEVSRTAKDFSSGELTTGTAVPGFDQNFHQVIPYGMAYEYFIANSNLDQARNYKKIIDEYEARVRRQYGKKQRDFPMRFDSEFINYN